MQQEGTGHSDSSGEQAVNGQPDHHRSRTIFHVALGTGCLAGLFVISWHNYLLFHFLAELFSIAVAWGVFMLVWNARGLIKNDALVLLGIGFLFVGLLDLLHTLAYKGTGIFPSHEEADLATQLWVSARYMQAFSLLAFPLLLGRRMRAYNLAGIYGGVTGLVLLAVFAFKVFPSCYVEGEGLTIFNKSSEFLICMILGGALAVLYRRRKHLDKTLYKLLAASILFTIAAEFAFTFYVSVYGLSNLLGHFLKIISFFLVYLALIRSGLTRPYNILFRELKEQEDELQLSEKVLEEEREQLLSIFDSIDQSIYVSDPYTYEILYVNRYLREMLQKPLIGGICYREFQGLDRPCEFCTNRIILEEKGNPYSWEHHNPLIKKDFHVVDRIIRWPDGRDVRFEMAIDITARKQVEEALRESREWMRAILEASPDPIVVYDLEGTPLYINRAFTEAFGWELEEIMGRPIPFVPEDEKERTLEKIREGYRTGKAVSLETRRYTKEGKVLNIIVSAAIFKGADGKPAGMVADLTDITKTKRLEAQFHGAQRMESLGTLAGGIAHDFNNLLTGIQGNVSLLLLQEYLSRDDYEKLKSIEQYINDGAKLTKQLLGFARRGKFDVKPLDLNRIIKNTAQMFGRTMKGIEIRERYEEGVRAVEADAGQMEQVLLNLFLNAADAMPVGGKLCLETKDVNIDEDYIKTKPFEIRPGKYVKISVEDTGVGMDKETLERIFEPFFTTKEMGRGTGLGLASVYGIIKNHGGFINVYSEKGEGTTFNLYLPVSESGAGAGTDLKKDKQYISYGKETVLLVDDEEMVIDVGRQLLCKLGYQVLTARGGREAIRVYEENKEEIDMVILDMIMPDMGGGETFNRLRQINPQIKVLLSSGYSVDGQATEILKQGCNGFMQKPFNLRALSKKLREILDQ